MTSRLRIMILINARNSGKACSGRITEIDPRGGAAITGPNGVGKTTTLQLLPLFFGFSPNQMAPVGANRESMLRFVLSQPESSVAFEYQRGEEAGDNSHIGEDVGRHTAVSVSKKVTVERKVEGFTSPAVPIKSNQFELGF